MVFCELTDKTEQDAITLQSWIMRRPEHTEDRSPVELPWFLIQGGSFLTAFQAAQHISILTATLKCWRKSLWWKRYREPLFASCLPSLLKPETTECRRERKTMLSQAVRWRTHIMVHVSGLCSTICCGRQRKTKHTNPQDHSFVRSNSETQEI